MACAATSKGTIISGRLPSEVKDRLESLVDNVKIVKKQIKAGSSSARQYGNSSFSRPSYWSDLASRVDMVSNWCTKLTVFFSKPPAPKLEECGPVIHGIENSILTMVSAYFGLPPTEGITVCKELQEAVLDILSGVESLADTVITHGCEGQFKTLKETGSVWNSCDKISSVSKDNRAAVLRVFITSLQLQQDACSEAEEIIVDGQSCMNELELALGTTSPISDDVDCNELSDTDKKLIHCSIRLIKTCHRCVADISRAITKYGNTVTCDGIEQLDAAAAVVIAISPCVDDLVSSLYSPISRTSTVQAAEELKDCLLSFVEKCSKLDFCKAAQFLSLDVVTKDILEHLEQLHLTSK